MTANTALAWFDLAVCAGTAIERQDHELFFGRATSEGKALCAICPVAYECLEYAERNELGHGLYGGLDQDQRRQFLNRYVSVTTPRGRAAHQRILERLNQPYRKKEDDDHRRSVGLRPGR